MKEYFITVFITVVVISLIQILLPKGKISKAATCVLSVVITFCFFNVAKLFPLENIFDLTEAATDCGNLDEYVDKNLKEYYECAFFTVMKENDLICERVYVEICDKKLTKIEIYLSNLVIDGDNEHINNNVITDYVAAALGVDKEILTVYC